MRCAFTPPLPGISDHPLTPIFRKSAAQQHPDSWLSDLHNNGFAVIKGAIPRQRALSYQQRARAWLKSFGNDTLDYDDPSTWVKKNLPVHTPINTFGTYAGPHEKFMWDARMEPGVVDAFAQIWGTDELLASFDSLNITFPNRTDVPRKQPWEHVDQSPLRRGMHCVQGIICLSTAGPNDGGLVVYPGSHKHLDEFLDTQTDRAAWTSKDIYFINKDHQKWFHALGCTPHRVCADVGDLIVWDSRTVHYGSEPEPASHTIRTVIYAAYTPARLASPETLALKAEVFRVYGGTTHWPHDNVRVRDTKTYLENGTRDPRDRSEPLEKPELTDRLLKLAGIKPY